MHGSNFYTSTYITTQHRWLQQKGKYLWCFFLVRTSKTKICIFCTDVSTDFLFSHYILPSNVDCSIVIASSCSGQWMDLAMCLCQGNSLDFHRNIKHTLHFNWIELGMDRSNRTSKQYFFVFKCKLNGVGSVDKNKELSRN